MTDQEIDGLYVHGRGYIDWLSATDEDILNAIPWYADRTGCPVPRVAAILRTERDRKRIAAATREAVNGRS